MTDLDRTNRLGLLDEQVATAAVRHSVTVGAAAQVVAKVLHLIFNVVSTLAVVHFLAPAAYGVYAVVLMVTTLVTFVADFGLPKIAVREICAGADEASVVGTVLAMRVGLAVIGIGMSEGLLLVLQQPPQAFPAAAIASLTGVGESLLASAVIVFQLRLAQQWEAALRAGAEFVESTAIIVLVIYHASLVILFVPPAVMTLLGGVVAVAVVRHRYDCRPRVEPARARLLLRQALPVAPALVVSVLYHKMDSITLAALRPGRDIGLYSSAAQPIEYAFLTTALLMNTIYPLMSAAHARGDMERFAMLYRRGAESLVILTIVLPVVLVFVASPLVRMVFGADYAPAATPLILLSAAMVPLAVGAWQSLTLLLGGLQVVTLHYNLATLVVSAVLCIVLVTTLGTTGAGCASVGTALFMFGASTRAVRCHLRLGLSVSAFARIGAAAGLTAAALTLTQMGRVPWPALALVGLAAFTVAVRLTGAYRSVTGLLA